MGGSNDPHPLGLVCYSEWLGLISEYIATRSLTNLVGPY